MSAHPPERPISFATSLDQVESRRSAADQLLGARLESVTYVDIDYRRHEVAPEHLGPRRITEDGEWGAPTWRFTSCDSVDFGIELRTDDGRLACLTWDLPGDQEGLGIHFLPLVPTFVHEAAAVAVWDVSGCPQWAPLIGAAIGSIELHYEEFYRGQYWCPRISVEFGEVPVDFMLGDADAVTGEIKPSSDNVVVLLPSGPLPSWASP